MMPEVFVHPSARGLIRTCQGVLVFALFALTAAPCHASLTLAETATTTTTARAAVAGSDREAGAASAGRSAVATPSAGSVSDDSHVTRAITTGVGVLLVGFVAVAGLRRRQTEGGDPTKRNRPL